MEIGLLVPVERRPAIASTTTPTWSGSTGSCTANSKLATAWSGRIPGPRSAGVAPHPRRDDVEAHFRHAQAEGAVIDYEPVGQPYGYREYSARDSEGGLWSFMKSLD